MTSLVSDIKNHFEDQERVNHDVDSYQKNPSSTNQIDPYEPLREDLIVDLVSKHAPNTVLDIGCGIGHLVNRLNKRKIDTFGVDVSSTMIQTAKEGLTFDDINPNKVQCHDFLTLEPIEKYDAFIANGVIWYYPDKTEFLNKIKALSNSSARVWIVHRNLLFNLFALNQGTFDVFNKEFLSHLESDAKASVTKNMLETIPAFDTKIQDNGGLTKPYDNPLTIHELYDKNGFEVEELYYTYIHPCPPRFMTHCQDKNYSQAQNIYGTHWAGAFLGSQFIVQARLKP